LCVVNRPKPEGWTPPEAEQLVLVWGAASSVGMYVLQVLKYWGYQNLVAVASEKHHETLKGYGARACFDYRRPGVVEEVLEYVESVAGPRDGGHPRVPFIVDCIGSVEGTLRPLSKIAEPGAKVAVMLPVIKVHASEDNASELEMDVGKVLPGESKEGVELKGTRTFLYAKVSDTLKDFWHGMQLTMSDRTSSSRSTSNLISCPLCWSRGWSSQTSSGWSRARRCWREHSAHSISFESKPCRGRGSCGGWRRRTTDRRSKRNLGKTPKYLRGYNPNEYTALDRTIAPNLTSTASAPPQSTPTISPPALGPCSP